MSNPVFRFATVQGQNIHWFLQRNCSVTPARLAWPYLSLCVVSLAAGGVSSKRSWGRLAQEIRRALRAVA